MATSPSPTSYDVFLSFTGEETRLGFIGHLYTALDVAGFRTFRDHKDELEKGEPIDPELYSAIHNSKCSLVVLSKDYASSESCLNGLLEILERKKTSDHRVIPVFYHVNPDHVWDQTSGCYRDAVAEHIKRYKDDISKVNRWLQALRKASELAGMNLDNQADRHEAQFIKNIVDVVEDKLRCISLSININNPFLTGIESRLEKIGSWIEDGSTTAGILLVCGIPGIGKTTIAKSIYNSYYTRFEGAAFLENIKEISKQPDGLIQLQRKLLSILTRRKMIINNASEGANRIKDVIRLKSVLLVLDDVDHVEQLNAILGMQKWFYHESKIIVTTGKHDQLLKAGEAYKIYRVKPLDKEESLKLFCWHAFGQDHPVEHYEQLSEMIVDHCEGVPKDLQKLGRSSLSWKSIDYWESAIAKLKHTKR